jgi:hypothetical protein
MLIGVDEPEPGWRPGDTLYVDLPTLYVDLPDGQTVRCRILDIAEDGTLQVVPEHPVTIT